MISKQSFKEINEIKFTNKPENKPINFSVKITPESLTEFISEVSKFFIDNLDKTVENTPKL